MCRRCFFRSIGRASSEAARWRTCARSASAQSRDWACHRHLVVMRFSTLLRSAKQQRSARGHARGSNGSRRYRAQSELPLPSLLSPVATMAVEEEMFPARSARSPLVLVGAIATAGVLVAGLVAFKKVRRRSARSVPCSADPAVRRAGQLATVAVAHAHACRLSGAPRLQAPRARSRCSRSCGACRA